MLLQYDQKAGEKAGSMGITECGAYTGMMLAKQVVAKTGTKGIEFNLKSEVGEARYMKVWYEKPDGTQLSGNGIISAIMGLLKLPGITTKAAFDEDGKDMLIIPEFEGQQIGFVLQKVLYSKADNSDGYKFDIKLPFSASTGVTLKEALNGQPATAANKLADTLTVKDERNKGGNGAGSGGGMNDMDSYSQMSQDGSAY